MKKRCQCQKCLFESMRSFSDMGAVHARKALTSVRILFARYNIPEAQATGPVRTK